MNVCNFYPNALVINSVGINFVCAEIPKTIISNLLFFQTNSDTFNNSAASK